MSKAKTVQDIFDTFTEQQKESLYFVIDSVLEVATDLPAIMAVDYSSPVLEVYQTLDPDQLQVWDILVKEATKNAT